MHFFVKFLTSCISETLMPPQWPFFRKLWPWYLTLTLTDDLDYGTKERDLPQGIYICDIWKLYHLPFKSYGQCISFCGQTNRLTVGLKTIWPRSIDAGGIKWGMTELKVFWWLLSLPKMGLNLNFHCQQIACLFVLCWFSHL